MSDLTTLPTLPECEDLLLELSNGWLNIWLNRPEVKNALSTEVVDQLSTVLKAVRDFRSVRGITLRGKGGVFCAGGDIKGFKAIFQGGEQNEDDIAQTSIVIGELLDLMNSMPQVVVILVEGPAMAGGFGLCCCADVLAVTEDALFAVSETTIGVVPAQIAPFIAERVGLRTARRLMMTAGRLDGNEAARIGLADYVVADAEGLEGIEAQVKKQVSRCAPGAAGMTKDVLLASRYLDRPAMLDYAGKVFAKCMLAYEGKEGVSAFLEKRKPVWAQTQADKN